MKKRLGFWLWFILFIGVFVTIILSTSMTGDVSSDMSLYVAEYVRQVAQYIVELSKRELNFIIRKIAHVSIFCLMSICFTNIIKYGINNKFLLFLVSAGFVSILGVLDELRQYYVSGRVMAVNDMLFDSMGAVIGSILVIIYLKISKFNLME